MHIFDEKKSPDDRIIFTIKSVVILTERIFHATGRTVLGIPAQLCFLNVSVGDLKKNVFNCKNTDIFL